MQAELDRVLRRAQEVGHLARRQAVDVAHHQHRAMPLRQLVDASPHQRARLFRFERIAARFSPRHHRFRVMTVFGEAREHRLDRLLGPPLPRPDPHQRRVDDDAVEPGRELGMTIETLNRTEGGEKGVLHGVAGGVFVPQQAAGHGEQMTAARPHQFFVGGLVAGLEPGDEGLLGGHGSAGIAPSRAPVRSYIPCGMSSGMAVSVWSRTLSMAMLTARLLSSNCPGSVAF